MFMNKLKEELNQTTKLTENGAVGYESTGDKLLDVNFKIPSYRGATEETILSDFVKAFAENPKYAITYLFFARDAREGLGERRFFKICFKWLCEAHSDVAKKLIPFIAEYGRWDDIFCAYDTVLKQDVLSILREQLISDICNMTSNKPISLLAKWLPSINTSNKDTVKLAKEIYSELGLKNEKSYRKTLSALRKYLDVTEVKTSSNQWDKIDYSAVPSKANILYKNAFMKHDTTRRMQFLQNLGKGETKINASVLYPYDIVNKYSQGTGWSTELSSLDATLEELWKALPNKVQDNGNTLVVADGSGSMHSTIGDTNISALSVGNSLAIYFAEKCKGEFANKYITFSNKPQFVDFSNCKTLRDKLELALKYDECANTDIVAVFNLILKTAINNNIAPDDIPKNILIISDMEFDYGVIHNQNSSLFDTVSDVYEAAGYQLPHLIFWNVNSRTNTIPMQKNNLGVTLVSGFSINICDMVLSGILDPYACLLNKLNEDRYLPIREIAEQF